MSGEDLGSSDACVASWPLFGCRRYSFEAHLPVLLFARSHSSRPRSPSSPTPVLLRSAAFVFEGEIEPLINRVLDHHLTGKQYVEADSAALANFILEDLLQGLTRLDKPFKYVCNCILMQNTGAGLHAALGEFLDGMNDGAGTVRWPSDKVKEPTNIYCVVTVCGLSLLVGQ